MRRQLGRKSSRPGRPVVLAWKLGQLGRESQGHWKMMMRRQQRVWAQLWAVTCQCPDLARAGGKCGDGQSYLVHHANDESFLLNLVGLDGVLILQDFAYRLVNEGVAPEMVARVSRTSVDQLLQLGLPSLLLRDLLLDSGDLDCVLVSFARARSHR